MEGKAALENLLGEEQSLTERAKMLKSDLEGLNFNWVSKQNQVDWLFAKVADLNSGKRTCPFPNDDNNGESHQEKMKLNHERNMEPERLAETILNADMWREVFAKVDDGQDLLNANRTCQHFNDILEPLKSNFLFGKIIPFLFLHLNFNDVLKCRLVCREWKSTTNSFLEEWTKTYMLDFPSYGFSHPFKIISSDLMWAYRFAIRPFANLIDANQFLQQFNSSVRNPFVANYIYLNADNNSHNIMHEYSKLLQHRTGISTILETFGRHIHHLNCYVEYLDPAGVDLLRCLFSKAKNLQTLVVRGIRDHVEELEFEDITDSLPNLRTLAYNIKGEHPIGNWLFRNLHLQITKLKLENYDGLVAASEFTWPAVIELKIDSLYMDEEKDCLKYLGFFPGLRKLCIFIWRSTLQNILCIIHNLPTICPSFHAVQLHIARLEAERRCEKEIIVNAPTELDTLELNLFDNDYWTPSRAFDFLLCFPFIKKLSIKCGLCLIRCLNSRRWRNFSKVEIVEIYKYLQTNSNPRSSNVWKMLPNLNTLQLQHKIYKRPKASQLKLKCE